MILAVEAGEVYYMFNTRAMQTNLLFLSIGSYGSAFGLGNAFFNFSTFSGLSLDLLRSRGRGRGGGDGFKWKIRNM